MAACAVQYAVAETCTVLGVYSVSSYSSELDLDCPDSGRISKTVHGNDYSVGETISI